MEDAKIINLSGKLVLLEVVHLDRGNGNETVLEAVGPGRELAVVTGGMQNVESLRRHPRYQVIMTGYHACEVLSTLPGRDLSNTRIHT